MLWLIFTGLTGAELKSHQFKLSILKQWPKLIKLFPSQWKYFLLNWFVDVKMWKLTKLVVTKGETIFKSLCIFSVSVEEITMEVHRYLKPHDET